jgi:hypothetical protein
MAKKLGFSKANKLLKKLPTKKQTEVDKKALLSYLSSEYDITYFNKLFVFKLEHIHEGTLGNLFFPIPYSVLLEMFRYYKHELEEQRIKNKSNGKLFVNKQAVLNYDLAITLNKHSDYLTFLQENQINANKTHTPQETVKLVSPSITQGNANGGDVDINELLESW